MNDKKPIAYAVDVDSGKVAWYLYDEPWKSNMENERYYLDRALNLEV